MGRRPKGEGSIYQRADGYFVGKYQGKTVYGKTKTEAKDKLNILKSKIELSINENQRVSGCISVNQR